MNKKILLFVILITVGFIILGSVTFVIIQNSNKSEGIEETFTLSEVEKLTDEDNCYTAINGKVYNLTKEVIKQHPGGSGTISSVCGIDASSAFEAMHGDNNKANSWLEDYYVGELESSEIDSEASSTE